MTGCLVHTHNNNASDSLPSHVLFRRFGNQRLKFYQTTATSTERGRPLAELTRDNNAPEMFQSQETLLGPRRNSDGGEFKY